MADLKRTCPGPAGAVIDAMGVTADEFIRIFLTLNDNVESSEGNEGTFKQLEVIRVKQVRSY